MKAKVQYNDYLGTAAADRSDYVGIENILINRGVDTNQFIAIGLSIYFGYSDFFTASIICIDKLKTTESKKHIVEINFENKFDAKEILNFFKRFNVLILNRENFQENLEVDEEITIDDRKLTK